MAYKLHAVAARLMPMVPSAAAAAAARAEAAEAHASVALPSQQSPPLDAGTAAEAWRVAFFRDGGDAALRNLLAIAVDPQQGGIQAEDSSAAESERVGRAVLSQHARYSFDESGQHFSSADV